MLKEDLILIAQERAREYSTNVKRQRRNKRLKKVAIGISMTAFFVASFGLVGKNDLEVIQAKETEASQYIVRYGTMGTEESILTMDGNIWLLSGPEYSTGTEVRVLFDGKGTVDVTDDVIIDITERR
jgi:hypothetical protein